MKYYVVRNYAGRPMGYWHSEEDEAIPLSATEITEKEHTEGILYEHAA